jgi:Ser/Thr protein kinase RdoA (MazF antagonist)
MVVAVGARKAGAWHLLPRHDRRVTRGVTPRAVGPRIDFVELPVPVRAWVEDALGDRVVAAATQVGGFSAGVAARLRTEDGRTGFVKAVDGDVNAQTPGLFRHEIAVLEALPDVDYRASLRASYDDGTWVGLLLDDVDGRHPDLHDDRDVAAVNAAILAQARELTPDPVRLDVPDMAQATARWHRRVVRELDRDPSQFPAWFVAESDSVLGRLASLPDRMPGDSWVHLDIRDDNLLVRPDGSAVILDWGMSRSGPSWLDQVLLAVHRVEAHEFDEMSADVVAFGSSAARGAALQDDITDLVLALGASLAALRDRPMPGLPAIDEFRRREQARLLEGARRRLGL